MIKVRMKNKFGGMRRLKQANVVGATMLGTACRQVLEGPEEHSREYGFLSKNSGSHQRVLNN